jgi:hypothetical protein
MPVILATWEAEIEMMMVQGQCGQIVCRDLISKTARAKWAGDVTQVLEHVLHKHEALSLNSSPTIKRKQRKKERKC